MAQSAKTQESKAQEPKAVARTHEPSMEEILASIRRIIADEDANASARSPAEPGKAESKPVAPASSPMGSSQMSHSAPPTTARRHGYESSWASEETREPNDDAAKSSAILDLTESMATPAAKPSEPAAILEQTAAAAAPRGQAALRENEVSSDRASDRIPMPLFTETSVGGEVREQLLSTETSAAVDSAFNALAQTVLVHNARTLEDLVREMLRPLLKSWLDDNLPSMVERLVRAEIERVSRGRSS
jgi:uncharacterized protein